MSEVKRYLINKTPIGTIMKPNAEGNWIASEDFDRVTAERDAALGREAALKEVTSFKDAVACVFDNLKIVACNTDDRAWDDRLEDLAEDVIEMSPEYKKQWKDICRLSAEKNELQQRLTAADERVDVLEGLLREARHNHGVMLLSDPPRDAWKHHRMNERIDAALKPAEVKLCKTCNGTGIVSDGAMYCSSGGIPFECGPIECVKDCPECTKP